MPSLTHLSQLQQTHSKLNHPFLESFLNTFADGILILTFEGELLYVNQAVHQITTQYSATLDQTPVLYDEINYLFQIISNSLDPSQTAPHFVEADLFLTKKNKLRIQARRFKGLGDASPLILIAIEDLQNSINATALIEAEKYGLTERETEVWQLRRANYTYLEIAGQLYISINTVKKHLKSISSKIEFYECRFSQGA